jgi:hypothetical protein
VNQVGSHNQFKHSTKKREGDFLPFLDDVPAVQVFSRYLFKTHFIHINQTQNIP